MTSARRETLLRILWNGEFMKKNKANGAKSSSSLTEVGYLLHQEIRKEQMLEKAFGDMIGFRYMMKLALSFLSGYIGVKTSLPYFYT